MAYIYLASPYTHKSHAIREKRYLQAAEVAAQYLRKKLFVYSPIVHCHTIALNFKLPKGFDFWKEYNFAMLEAAAALHVLALDGWEDSKGVQEEIQKAHTLNIPTTIIPYPLKSRS